MLILLNVLHGSKCQAFCTLTSIKVGGRGGEWWGGAWRRGVGLGGGMGGAVRGGEGLGEWMTGGAWRRGAGFFLMGCGFKRRGGTGRVNEGQGLTNKGGAYINRVWLGEEGRGLKSEAANSQWFQFNLFFFFFVFFRF